MILKTDHIDQWGTEYVICPACNGVYNRMGIIHHMQSCKDEEHRDELKAYYAPREKEEVIPIDQWPWKHKEL